MKKIMKKLKVNPIYQNVLIAFIILMSLYINPAKPTNGISENIYDINKFIGIFAFIGIYSLISYINSNQIKSGKILKIISVFLGIGYVICSFYNIYGNLNYFIRPYYQPVKVILIIIGIALMVYYMLLLLKHIIENIKNSNRVNKWLNFIFDDHPVISTVIILLIVFIPLLIISFPGDIGPDGIDELKQFYHIKTWSVGYLNLINENIYINGHHSPVHTIIIGIINSIGYKLGSPNIGLFLNVIFQVFIAIFVLSYCMNTLKKIKVPIIVRLFVLLFYILSGFFTFGSLAIYKDIPFLYLVLLFSAQLIELIYLDDFTYKKIIQNGLTGLIMSFITKKGIYALALVVLLLVVIFFKRKIYKKIPVIIVPVLIYYAINSVLFPQLCFTPGSVREMLALPIQQVSRVVYYNDKEIPDKDQEIINNIIVYDQISEKYNPRNADPIKNELFNKDYTSKQMKDFLVLYIKYFFKYPKSYINSFLNLSADYFNPCITITPNNYTTEYWRINTRKRLNYNLTQSHSVLFKSLNKLYDLIVKIPVINIIYSQGLYTILLLILIIYILFNKDKKHIIPFIPAFIMLLFLFISPMANNRRYMLPIIASLPMLIAYITVIKNSVNNRQ